AYSSISHAGFILVGLEAATHTSSSDAALGLSSISSYLFIYSLLVIGTFAVASAVVGDGEATLDSFKGLGKSNPVLAFAMTVLLLAQAGVPVTSGFIAKFGVISSAASVESYPLAIVAMVAAVVAAYVYLRVIIQMWLEGRESKHKPAPFPSSLIVIALTTTATITIGLIPGLLLDFTAQL
ncbi:MAG: NADH-quinone oxidoreductase subunit N, partial [Actinobacteria bacterium]|nr:NADH-quinone oxidoreductase subunit N [Actinomycetota bacterium]